MPADRRRVIREFLGARGQSRVIYSGLGRPAVILIWLWAVGVVVLGVTTLLRDSFSDLWLFVLGASAFFMGLNIWLAALVVGLVAILRSGRRRLLRCVLFVVVLVGSVVIPFLLSGWTLGSGDEDQDLGDERFNHVARGVGIWMAAVVVVLVSSRLLRESPGSRLADTFDGSKGERSRRRWIVVARIGVATAVLGPLLVWVQQASRPAIILMNNTTETLNVEFCPTQECGGDTVAVEARGREKVLLRSKADPLTPDSLRVTRGNQLLGCILVFRDQPNSRNVTVPLSDADRRTC